MLRVKYSRYKQNLNKEEVSSIGVSVPKVKKVCEEQNQALAEFWSYNTKLKISVKKLFNT